MTGVKPWLVGVARATLTAAAAVLIVATLIQVLSGDDVPVELQFYAPILIAVLRSLEGVLDHRRDPAPQASLIKGGPLYPPTN